VHPHRVPSGPISVRQCDGGCARVGSRQMDEVGGACTGPRIRPSTVAAANESCDLRCSDNSLLPVPETELAKSSPSQCDREDRSFKTESTCTAPLIISSYETINTCLEFLEPQLTHRRLWFLSARLLGYPPRLDCRRIPEVARLDRPRFGQR
jgi:hypothetical protein